MPVEEPYVLIGQIASAYYFSYFLVMLPLLDVLESALVALVCSR